MPSGARKRVVDQDEVGVYHVWGRCVRRAWLCGDDPLSGNNYDYRRDWICKNEEAFAALFAIDIGFHVEMCNHLHLVLRTSPDVVASWSDEEVVRRVLTINNRTRNRAGETKSPEESTHTSAFDRIAGRDARQAAAAVALADDEREQRAPDGWLGELTLDERQVVDPSASLHSRTGRRASDKGLIPVSLYRYLELLD